MKSSMVIAVVGSGRRQET